MRTILITGASGSLGVKLVENFLLEGDYVIASDVFLNEEFESLDKTKFYFIKMKIVTEAFLVKGYINIVVNLVGLIHSEPALAFRGGKLKPHSYANWERTIFSNLTLPFLLSVENAAILVKQKEKSVLINFSSICAQGSKGQVAYSAAKSGVETFTKVLSKEFGPLGLRVNCIAPGFVDVASTHSSTNKSFEELSEKIDLGRFARAEEIQCAINFIWENEYVTGAVIKVDGGVEL